MTKRWQYGVLVRSHDRIEYYGLTVAYFGAVELQRAAVDAGWEIAKIFDTTLSGVTTPPANKKKPVAVN